MRYLSTPLAGAFVLEPEPFVDERGVFARTWDTADALSQGLDGRVSQCSTSFNRVALTLRGLHWQEAPWAEVKLVRCTAGAVFDVAVDLRPSSPTYRRWHGVHLTATNRRALYIPEGCAHGFLTLADDSEVFYQMSAPYHPEAAQGARWDDPALGIEWPAEPVVISEKDSRWALLPTGGAAAGRPIG